MTTAQSYKVYLPNVYIDAVREAAKARKLTQAAIITAALQEYFSKPYVEPELPRPAPKVHKPIVLPRYDPDTRTLVDDYKCTEESLTVVNQRIPGTWHPVPNNGDQQTLITTPVPDTYRPKWFPTGPTGPTGAPHPEYEAAYSHYLARYPALGQVAKRFGDELIDALLDPAKMQPIIKDWLVWPNGTPLAADEDIQPDSW